LNDGLLSELKAYREVFFFLVWRDIKVRYKQTLLGAAWAVLQPVASMIVFSLLFGKLAQMPSDGVPYPIFTYAALVPWTYFSTSLSFAGNSLVNNSNLVSKVYFPRIALPAASALGGLVDFAIASAVVLVLMAWYHIPLSWELLIWPVLALPLVALVLGVGMSLAALNVKFRDVKYAIPFALQMWLFLTPIIYPTSIVPERLRFLTMLNPLTGVIEAFRAALLPDRTIAWGELSVSVLLIGLIFIVALRYFHTTERDFADYI
jgi:lipopolysaccharide transport system permease protein